MSSPAKKPGPTDKIPRRNLAGKVILKLRKNHGLTRGELAAKVHVEGWDVSHKVIERIENGRREVNDIELRVLARALRVSPAALLDG